MASLADNKPNGYLAMAKSTTEGNIPQAPSFINEEQRWDINMDQLGRYDASWEAPIPPDMSLGILYSYREMHRDLWTNSKTRRQALDLIKKIFQRQSELPEPNFNISNCVCLGVGSLFGLANVGHVNENAPSVLTDGVNKRNMGPTRRF